MKKIALIGLLSCAVFCRATSTDESALIEGLETSARNAGIFRGLSTVSLSFALGGCLGGYPLALMSGLSAALVRFGSYAKISKKIKILKRHGAKISSETIFDESYRYGGATGAMISAAACFCIWNLMKNRYKYSDASCLND